MFPSLPLMFPSLVLAFPYLPLIFPYLLLFFSFSCPLSYLPLFFLELLFIFLVWTFCFLFCPLISFLALDLALCMRLSLAEVRKKTPEVQKRISRGSKKDLQDVSEPRKRLLKIMHREVEKEDRALFLGLIAGLKRSWRSKKKTYRGRKQDGPIARSGKRHFGVNKQSSPLKTMSTDTAHVPQIRTSIPL